MIRWVAAVAGLLLLATAVLLYRGRPQPVPPVHAPGTAPEHSAGPGSVSPSRNDRTATSPRYAAATGTPASNSPPALAPEPPAVVPPMPTEFTNVEPTVILESLRSCLRDYGSRFDGNPVGTNPEITAALNGDNPKQIVFLRADGNRVNSRGELVDSWGTPYFFHQLSARETEIRSAGPDKRMWTADDLLAQ